MPSVEVSIIIPCFRQAHLLGEAIASALGQTFTNREVIVVNDGSDDNTAEVCSAYGSRIVYLSQANQGLSAARNTGIAAARGRYLHFLDSDDVLHPEAIAEMVAAMQGRDNRLVVVGYREFETSINDQHMNEKIPHPGTPPFPQFIHGNFGPPLIFLSPRERVLAAGGFNRNLRSCEDWELWLRLVLGGADVVTIPRILTYYRRYAGSMSTNVLRMLDTRTQVLQFMHQEMLSRPELLREFGLEQLVAEHRVRRKWLVADPTSVRVAEVSQLIRELEQAGFQLPRSRPRRIADRCLGLWSDRLALKYFQWCDPNRYGFYSLDCN